MILLLLAKLPRRGREDEIYEIVGTLSNSNFFEGYDFCCVPTGLPTFFGVNFYLLANSF